MSKTSKQQLLERVASWPEEDIEKLEEAVRQIEAWRSGEYNASVEELEAIDEAIAELDRGERATPEQVKAVFAAFRPA
jgi:ribosome maturation protein Sdo1